MKRVYGVFETERRTAEAVQALREDGVEADRITVFVRSQDIVHTLEKEAGVAVQEAQLPDDEGKFQPAGWLAASEITNNVGSIGLDQVVPIAPVVTDLRSDNRGPASEGLRRLGVPEDEADVYGNYVDRGFYLLKAEVDDGKAHTAKRHLQEHDAIRIDAPN